MAIKKLSVNTFSLVVVLKNKVFKMKLSFRQRQRPWVFVLDFRLRLELFFLCKSYLCLFINNNQKIGDNLKYVYNN